MTTRLRPIWASPRDMHVSGENHSVYAEAHVFANTQDESHLMKVDTQCMRWREHDLEKWADFEVG